MFERKTSTKRESDRFVLASLRRWDSRFSYQLMGKKLLRVSSNEGPNLKIRFVVTSLTLNILAGLPKHQRPVYLSPNLATGI